MKKLVVVIGMPAFASVALGADVGVALSAVQMPDVKGSEAGRLGAGV